MHRRPTSLILALGTLFASAAGAQAWSETDVRYRHGEITLAAALLIPEGDGPFPAVVVLQGSGDSDRSNYWARSWAQALARDGIAALLTDKRGCGQSEGDWKHAGFDELAGDALAGVTLLRAQPKIDTNQIGLVGLSQGGFVVPLAGVRSPDLAFVIDISGSTTTPVEQVNHEMRNTFRQAGLDEAGVEAGMRLQALAASYIRDGDWAAYAAALWEAAETPLAPVAAGFPQSEDSWVWEWWRRIGDYDPLVHWQELTVPVLVLYGREDEQDNVPVAESVRRLEALAEGRDLTVRVFEGSGHALWEPGTDPHRPALRADAVELVTGWIHARAD